MARDLVQLLECRGRGLPAPPHDPPDLTPLEAACFAEARGAHWSEISDHLTRAVAERTATSNARLEATKEMKLQEQGNAHVALASSPA